MLKDEKMSVGKGEGECSRPRVARAAPASSPGLAGDLRAEVQPGRRGERRKRLRRGFTRHAEFGLKDAKGTNHGF